MTDPHVVLDSSGAAPGDGRPLALLSLQELVKLGSIVVHVQELLSPDGHDVDRVTLDQLLKDPEVVQLMQDLDRMALLPVRRVLP